MSEDATSIRQVAVDLLARREHSASELRYKLKARGFGNELIDTTLEQLRREGLQSDARYIEAYLHQRILKGYGPVRLRRELREKGIDEGLVASMLESFDDSWMQQLQRVWEKKFAGTAPRNMRERARQTRFLQYRGFTHEQIRHLFESV